MAAAPPPLEEGEASSSGPPMMSSRQMSATAQMSMACVRWILLEAEDEPSLSTAFAYSGAR